MYVLEAGAVPVVAPESADGVFSLLWLVIALPLAGAAILLLGGRSTDRWGHWLGTAMPVGSFVLSVVLLVQLLGRDEEERQVGQHLYDWIQVGGLDVGADLLYDQLAALFLLLITGVGSLIHVYSIAYMEHDARRRRFFGYLNLFVAAMLTLILSANYVGLFLGWEGVGLASYLLIGFWQHKHSAAAAAKKAFVINRVGDMGMASAIFLAFVTFGTTDFAGISELAGQASETTMTALRHPAARRCLRQVRPGAAPGLAARRDGGPDPGLGPHPRRDHGHRRRLPGRALQLRLRVRPDRADLRRRGRRRHAPVGCGDRVRQGRHQEGAGRLHDEPDRLHDARRRARPGRLRVRDLPPASPTASSRPTCSSAPAR